MARKVFGGKCDIKYHAWSDNKSVAKYIWRILDGEMLLVVFDTSCLDYKTYKDRFYYYKETYGDQRELGSLSFSKLPEFEVVRCFDLFPNSGVFEPFTVIRPLEVSAREALLTFVSGNEVIHIFSNDLSLEVIEDLFSRYARDCVFSGNDTWLSSYLLENYDGYMSDGSLFFIDTICDDEDLDRYFFVTTNKTIFDEMIQS